MQSLPSSCEHLMTRRLLVAAALAAGLSAQVSQNCELLSQRTHAGSTGYAGVWGYVDPQSGREFALVGARNGTWIMETTDPRNPVERGFIPGPTSTWREISSYRQYVYAVTEAGGGVQIISMANPDAPVLVRTHTRTGWNNTHSVSVDQGRGVLYCNGTSQGLLIFDLAADPTNPAFVTAWTGTYVHDSFIQNGWCYASCINAGQLRILDVSALPAITQLSATRTPNAFTHNAWVTSDDRIAITTDETATGYLQFYDVTNKSAPVARGSFGVPGAGVHNVFIVEDKVAHVSWYGAGYRAVDMKDPSAPTAIGYYDTANAWGCYPFQPSGTIYISDIPSTGGLFCVRLTCGVPQRYGTATAGSGGITPEIHWGGGVARVGNATFEIAGRRMLGGAFCALAVGAAQADLPVAGIRLLVDPAQPLIVVSTTSSGSGPGNGSASVPVRIPNDSSLANASVYAQWIVRDAGAAAGLAASKGSRITICP